MVASDCCFRVPSDFIYPFFFPFRCRYYSAPGNESDYPFALLSPAAGAGAPADQWQAVTMPRDDLIQPTIGLQPHACYCSLPPLFSALFCFFFFSFLFHPAVRLPQVGTNSTFLRAWLRDEDQVSRWLLNSKSPFDGKIGDVVVHVFTFENSRFFSFCFFFFGSRCARGSVTRMTRAAPGRGQRRRHCGTTMPLCR